MLGPCTVADAMDAYLRFLGGDGRGAYTIRDARYRDQAFIRPKLGNTRLLHSPPISYGNGATI